MNRLIAWTFAAVAGAAVAVVNLVTAWPLHLSVVLVVLTLGLFGIALALFVGLVIVGFGDRRNLAGRAANSLELVRSVARSVRVSALASIALSVMVFANCSGAVLSNNRGPMDDFSSFLGVGAAVLLPIVLTIALVAAFATAAETLATRSRLRSAHRVATAALVSAVAVAVVAVLTVPVGFIFGVAYCDFGTSPGACAAGVASFGNVFMTALAALLLPYTLTLVHAIEALSSSPRGPDQAA